MRIDFSKEKAIFQIIILITSLIFFSASAEEVSASDACCEKTTSGEYCLYTDSSQCDPSFRMASTTCEQTSYCQPGCCFDLEEGICHKNVPLARCTSLETGEWATDETCSGVSSCQKGCCIIGAQCVFVTEQSCGLLTAQYPELTMNWQSEITSESACQLECLSEEEGCCVKADGTCSFTTRNLCEGEDIETEASNSSSSTEIGFFQNNETGFYRDLYCANIPACECTAHSSKKCYEGDVYWLDSCGNREGLAEDCDYASGTICKEDNSTSSGGARCVSVNCESTYDSPHVEGDGGFRKNGESWCSYDSATGGGFDLVGSRHYRHMCVNGEEIVEPCQDFREEFCYNAQVETYKEAQCRTNRYKDCATECNTAKDATSQSDYIQRLKNDYECCTNIAYRDCLWTGEDSSSGRCIPLVPPGLKFWPDDISSVSSSTRSQGAQTTDSATSSANAEEVCKAGDIECKVYFYKPPSLIDDPDWECKANCECLEPDFARGTATLCRAMGDCGAYYNIACDYTDSGFDVEVSDESGCAGKVKDTNFDVCLTQQMIGPCSMFTVTEKGIDFGKWDLDMNLWEQYGGYLPAAMLAMFDYAIGESGFSWAQSAWSGTMSESTVAPSILETPDPLYVGDGGSPYVGSYSETASEGVGFEAGSTTAQIGAAAIAGVLAAVTTYMKTGSATDALVMGVLVGAGTFVGGPLVGAVLNVVLNMLMGEGETKEVIVSAKCKPWEAPTGGDKCELCTDQEKWEQLGFDTCSLYKCKSLGQNCRFIPQNEGTGEGACYNADPNDVSSPVISPWEEALSEGYSISLLSYGYEINPEVKAFTRITFGIQTNEISQCKISEEHTESFESMANYFGDDNLFRLQHNATLILENGKEFEFYVRCQDPNGNANAAEYVIKMKTETLDLMAPIIEEVDPVNYAFIKNGVAEQLVRIYVNEPANCKYDKQDLPYEQMQHSFQGDSSGHQSGIYYNSKTYIAALTNISIGENDYYIRCQDTSGNVNQQSYHYVLIGTEPLNITGLSPEGLLLDTDSPVLQVTTFSGAENGKSKCFFSLNPEQPQSLWPEFLETDSSVHSQLLQNLSKGDYNYSILCEDAAGNQAEGLISFTIDKDTQGPELNHIYMDSSVLHVILNEVGSCQYGNETFSYGEGQPMSGSGTVHHTLSITEPYYYINCADVYNNAWSSPITVYL